MRILYMPHQYSQQRQREKRRWIYPVLLAMQAQYYRNLGHEVIWDKEIFNADKIIVEPENIDFSLLPAPDRKFTNAFDKKYQDNGNFKYKPATYMQVANGCWWGKCSFCVEKKNEWKVRTVDDVIDEIVECRNLGFKEIFDDSGTFPSGKWLDDFIEAKYNFRPDFSFGCNFRMIDAPYSDMKQSGFRMLLFGIESANQRTLDRINKGVKVEDIKYVEKAAEAGLECHIAVMFGYPWETDAEAFETLRLCHNLLRKGIAKTAQASFFKVANEESQESQRCYVKRIYDVAKSPEFWFHKIHDVKNMDDLKYLWRQIREGLRRGK